MKSVWRALLLSATLTSAGCQGNDLQSSDGGVPTNKDPFAPCTDLNTCCKAEEKLECQGDPDSKMICTCRGLWDCTKNPKKCEQLLPTPPGGTDWQCTWDEFKYVCTGPGTQENNPQNLPGGTDWACTWKSAEFKWECSTSPPNPTNAPSGTSVWKCTPVVETINGQQVNILSCERTDTGTPPTGSGTWNCTTDASGKTICKKVDDNGGLPAGSDWSCNRTTVNGVATWVCYGESATPPSGSGWNCTQLDEFNHWKCVRPENSGDIPPGGGWYACVKGSEFGGTVCEKVPEEPVPPTPTTNDLCAIGEKMWCDGLQYCGWGQVDCDPATGKWRTKLNDAGQTILDCQESMAGGKRPNTTCACYHFFFNPACCERPDCIVPPGTNGQTCPASKGGLCDYCNPQASECSEQGAKCIVTNSHETFCGRLCGNSSPCPNGYTCMVVKLSGNQSTNQCVPADYSCYY